MNHVLWVDKYRPNELADYVWRDDQEREKVEEWLSTGVLPHLCFSGSPGTGKTSLALMMLKLLNVPDGDILIRNAVKIRTVDKFQETITNFVSTWPFGNMKYVVLDEADRLSATSQEFLKHEIEKYSDTCRFIFTCNNASRLISPLISRCQCMDFRLLDYDDFIARVGQILMSENVKFEVDDLVNYVKATYPDMRRCINLLEQSTVKNKLSKPRASDVNGSSNDYLLNALCLFQEKRFREARKCIVENVRADEYIEIYQFLSRNLDLWGNTLDLQDDAFLVIRKGMLNHAIAGDPEINLAATIIELGRVNMNT